MSWSGYEDNGCEINDCEINDCEINDCEDNTVKSSRTAATRAGALAGALALGVVLTACGADPAETAGSAAPVSESPTSESNQASGTDQPDEGTKQNEKEEDKEGGAGSGEVDISNSELPSVEVKDVANGADVNLAGLVPSDQPILLWAWAPHCPVCAAEAPAVESFAASNADRLSVVGLGTQDDFAYAERFVSTYGVQTPRMLWDPGFESWRALQITGQPTWVLISPGGEILGRWQGGLPEDEILDKV